MSLSIFSIATIHYVPLSSDLVGDAEHDCSVLERERERDIYIDLEVTTKKTCKLDLNKFIFKFRRAHYLIHRVIQGAFFSGIPLILRRRKLFSSSSYSKGLAKNPFFEVISLHGPMGPNRIFIIYTLITNHDHSASVDRCSYTSC